MAHLFFCDTETTGLLYEHDEVWHIYGALAKTGDTQTLDSIERLIEVDEDKLRNLPQKFQDLHNEVWNNPWYQELKATPEQVSLDLINMLAKPDYGQITFIAANPAFDARMIQNNGILSQGDFYELFSYHMVDIEAFALGYLRRHELGIAAKVIPREAFVPFKSDDLTRAILGEDYLKYGHKHDARNDVQWIIDMWLAMNNGKF